MRTLIFLAFSLMFIFVFGQCSAQSKTGAASIANNGLDQVANTAATLGGSSQTTPTPVTQTGGIHLKSHTASKIGASNLEAKTPLSAPQNNSSTQTLPVLPQDPKKK